MLTRRSFTKGILTLPILSSLSIQVRGEDAQPTPDQAPPSPDAFFFGFVPDLPSLNDRPLPTASPGTISSLPKTVSLRDKMPDVYNQKQIGSCTANAAAAAVQFARKKEFGAQHGFVDFPPSRLFIYYNGRAITNQTSIDAGLSVKNAFQSIENLGVCPESEWPYDAAPADPDTHVFASTDRARLRPNDKCFADAKPHIATQAFSLGQKLDQMRACLGAGYPFAFGFTLYSSFWDSNGWPKTTIPYPNPDTDNPTNEGHTVLAVGYDDDKQLFTLRNSWGTSFQDKGYFYMPYSYLTSPQLSSSFWTLRHVLAIE